MFQGHEEYLVKWKDYPITNVTWEPLEHIPHLDLLWNATPHPVRLTNAFEDFERAVYKYLTSNSSSGMIKIRIYMQVQNLPILVN